MSTINDLIKTKYPDLDTSSGKMQIFLDLVTPFTQDAVYQELKALYPTEPSTFNDLLKAHCEAEVVLTPVITEQPQDEEVPVGSTAVFSVQATVQEGTLEYQWQTDVGTGFTDIPLEVQPTLSIPTVNLGLNGNSYRAVVRANGRSAVSRAALLVVLPL